MIVDTTLIEMYQQFYFLKKEANFSLSEIYDLYPYEMELFYWMVIKELKDKQEAQQKALRK